jgi:hypothetical protein
MRRALWGIAIAILVTAASARNREKAPEPAFQTSDRCLACHNGLQTPAGEDVSIGFQWRASIMANSSRDPYWQGSVRRESIDHPESIADIEDECSVCHMPIVRYELKVQGKKGQIFAHIQFSDEDKQVRQAEDGVSCSVCHQIIKEKFGTRESFNGGFVVDRPDSDGLRPEYGPYEIERGQTRIMRTSSEGYRPTKGDHIRQSELCATCHTLYTKALGPGGKIVGELPEQMPYPEWLHSDYKDKQSCQSCHMPVIEGDVPITRVLGVARPQAARHVFVGGNFFMLKLLNRFRDELSVKALVPELNAAAERTAQFLRSQTANLSIENVEDQGGMLRAEVAVENLTGHKLPTGYPSRRAWLHVTVRDANKRVVFESGAVNPDGSIHGNDNDANPSKFESHYREIRDPEQVEIYESILGDSAGQVTTGLLTGVRYLKDNRMLPHGFDKRTANPDVAVIGDAAEDPGFTDRGSRVRYSVSTGNAQGPFSIEAELLYQPIAFRWANNLKKYDAAEPRRFTGYYDAMGTATTVTIAKAAR